MLNNWCDDYIEDVINVWFKYRDFNCLSLVISNLQVAFLVRNFDDIKQEITTAATLSKLLIRVGGHDLKYLEEVKKTDAITYTYVLGQLEKSMDYNESLQIFYTHKCDERVGLLLWSFGQMRLEHTLEQIIKELKSDH